MTRTAILAPAICLALLAPSPALAQKTEPKLEVRVYDASDAVWIGFQTIAETVVEDARIQQAIPGMFLIEARTEDHDRLREALASVRQLLAERVAVSISLHSVARDDAPAVGDAAPEQLAASPALRRIETVVPRRMMITTGSAESLGYIADITPIVGNSSSAYDPTVDEADSGLQVGFSVSAPQPEGSLVTIHAKYSTATIRTSFQDASVPAQLDLVSRRERELAAAVRVGDRPTVAAIADDPDDAGRLIALVVSLRDAP